MKSPRPTGVNAPLRLVVVVPNKDRATETFIRAHVERLPFQVLARYGIQTDLYDANGRKIWRWGWWFREGARRLAPTMNLAVSRFLLARHLKVIKADAVLAEYGTTGDWLAPACAMAGVPLFVHFHGFDAWRTDVLEAHGASYRQMFETAVGVVAVSEPMREQLLTLGAKPDRLHINIYGVDPGRFAGAHPAEQPPCFLAVGRFVEKKAPYLTLLAFAMVRELVPDATLTMVGEGPLLGACKRLAAALGVAQSVTFPGAQDSDQVSRLMREARAFVQHSLAAEDGDCEGTPVALIEAQMTGLPVVSTRHAGIPQVVAEGETGFLVDEGDAKGMAVAMRRLVESPALAGTLGKAARDRALARFTLDRHVGDLARMIESRVSVSFTHGAIGK
ncbi:MAG: glycosyltransferase [Thiohalocapsa sp.]